ncbi:hypothetical protein [Chryseobacterium lathyri]|uniref:Uncharacterized protein n=1 Tax=Chryseobacterium lathyri TaxID=395933 RepID=A0ABT9SJ19_9FLAO|nr:hypothetical protein [Chryseobacterium lathyri]MDP9959429.1 hypothetical protein [Chryseobacterium lathyri]MDQ0064997.1 hypothetical protein [Chryseobacterium lathyri]
MTTLKEEMKEWTDADIAMHQLALQLGMIPEDDFPRFKSCYWTSSEKSKALGNILLELSKIGFLEFNQDEYTFKVNPDFIFEND